MIRVKDPEKSLKFYQEVMGMSLMRTSEQKEAWLHIILSWATRATMAFPTRRTRRMVSTPWLARKVSSS